MANYLNVLILRRTVPKTDLKINSLIKLHTLFLLSRRKIHGYEIIKALQQNFGAKISASQVYPFLAALRNKGYIWHSGTDKREKKEYSLTAEGRMFIRRISSKFASIMDFAIASKVRLCAHCDCEVYKGGYDKRVKGRALYFCCENCAGSYTG